jgi:hypothetical protein
MHNFKQSISTFICYSSLFMHKPKQLHWADTSREACSLPGAPEILRILLTERFNTVIAGALRWSLSWSTWLYTTLDVLAPVKMMLTLAFCVVACCDLVGTQCILHASLHNCDPQNFRTCAFTRPSINHIHMWINVTYLCYLSSLITMNILSHSPFLFFTHRNFFYVVG